MNGHNITNESLALSMVLVLIAILVSYREKLALEKDIIWSICRAIVQLIIVGYVLKYIFNVDHAVLTLLMVLFICFNAAWNAKKRSKYIDKAFYLVVYRHHYWRWTNAGGTGVFWLDRLRADAGDPDCRDGGRERHGGGGAVLQQYGPALQQRAAADSGETEPRRDAEDGLSAADSREHSRVIDSHRRFGENGRSGELAWDDVGADFCRY